MAPIKTGRSSGAARAGFPARHEFRVGTAGWSNPRGETRAQGATLLQHYATRFNCVEINSSFYRQHRRETYERWAASTPEKFRFSVKLPKEISHEHGLRSCEALLDDFVDGVCGLGAKLGCVLVQLPPRLEWNSRTAGRFFRALRTRLTCPVACEPRHTSWAGVAAERLMHRLGVSLVDADPARLDRTWDSPGGVKYLRWHGSPRTYWSGYTAERLLELAVRLRAERPSFSQIWCVFDNTASGEAWPNAMALITRLGSPEQTSQAPNSSVSLTKSTQRRLKSPRTRLN